MEGFVEVRVNSIALEWTAIALSTSVPKEVAVRVTVGSHDLAVWRGQDGKARVWENRCPHRGMRLSYGFVRENSLTCLYHGWGYDGEGVCKKIPAHPELEPPKTITVNRYLAFEAGGFIWTAAEGTTDAPSPSGEWHPCRSLHIRAEAQTVRGCLGGTEITAIEISQGVTVLCSVQNHASDESMLHVSISDPAHMTVASQWAIAVRADAEGSGGSA